MTRSPHRLIHASAGTGKTWQLSGRFLELLFAGVFQHDLAELFRAHPHERVAAGGDHFAIDFHDKGLSQRRAADPYHLVVFHADAVIHEHVSELFEAGVTHGGGIVKSFETKCAAKSPPRGT